MNVVPWFCRFPLLCAALFLLAACSAGKHTGEDASPAPAASSAAPPSASAPAGKGHLLFYESFGHYNSIGEHDFLVSEEVHAGQLCYKLENTRHEVSIYIPPQEDKDGNRVATVYYQDRSLLAELPVFNLFGGNAGGISAFHLEDLTSDGTPELVYLHGGGGTGVLNMWAKVFDLASMAQCPIDEDYSILENSIRFRPAGLQAAPGGGQMALFELTAPDGSVHYAAAETELVELPQNTPLYFGSYESLEVREGQLVLTSSFGASLWQSFGLSYLGRVSGAFAYDTASKSFSLQPPFTLEIEEPAAPHLSF